MIRRCVLLDSCTNFALQKAARAASVRTGAAFLLGMTGLTPATTFSSSVFAKTIRHSTPAFLRAVSYNRNHSTPTVRSRSHDGNCGANAHLSPTEDQNIFPNKDALLPMVDHKNKFPPNALRLWHRRGPSACRINTRH